MRGLKDYKISLAVSADRSEGEPRELQALRRAIHEKHASANKAAFLDSFLKGRGLYKPMTLVGPHEGKRASPHLAVNESGTVLAVPKLEPMDVQTQAQEKHFGPPKP